MKFFQGKPKPKAVSKGLVGKSYSDLISSKKAYHTIIGSLSVAVLVLSIAQVSKKTEVIVMPPDYYEPIILNGNYANTGYSAGHAAGIAALLGNVNPVNIDFVTKSVLKLMSPMLQSQFEKSMDTEAKIIKHKKARQSYAIEDVMVRSRDNLIWVWGYKKTTIGASVVPETFTYEFRIVPNHGQPKITHFDAYSGKPSLRQVDIEITPYLTQELKLVKEFAGADVKFIFTGSEETEDNSPNKPAPQPESTTNTADTANSSPDEESR